MRKSRGPDTEPCGIPAFTNFQLETDHLRQLVGVYYEKMPQMNQEDFHFFHYSLVYAEVLHDKLCQMPLISLRRHHGFLMMD